VNDYGYGLWGLAIIDTAVVLIFAASFYHPHSGRDWRAFGAFSAFIVALFTEMYGLPLSVYLLSSIGGNFLGLNLTHDGGHLWSDLVGWQGDPHLSPFHLASYAVIIAGFWLIASAWRMLYIAQRSGELAVAGPYARVRHPQYDGFILIMAGFLLQWPTIPTLLMFPVLLAVYRRLATREEAEVEKRFGDLWRTYAAAVPRFVPRRKRRAPTPVRPLTAMTGATPGSNVGPVHTRPHADRGARA
jgi:protein-S-isoprenylcysteine O-methyltransferase Ste14